MIDVNENREAQLQMNNLRNIDKIYTFYYDETNNIRKLHLTESGLNTPDYKNFVLAGIVHRGKRDIDFSALVNALHLQKTSTEIKLKHIGKGDFLELLNSKKLETVLQWLLDNDIFVHYCNLDVLYWSITDIVDSILAEDGNSYYISRHREIKNDLYKIIKADSSLCVKMLHGYGYPNVDAGNIKAFVQDVLNLIATNIHILSHNQANFLNNFISIALSLESLPFITDENSNVLIDSFFPFYLNRICLFKNSTHILDREELIINMFQEHPLSDAGITFCNYQFVDSKTEVAVQVSDTIAGFLGKYFTFINKVSEMQLRKDKMQMTTIQCKNLSLFRELINKSDDICNAFMHTIASDDDQTKHNLFLFT